MALTICLRCDKSYGESHPECPHCGASNFFADDAVLLPAVDVLIEQMYHEAAEKKKAKLAELQDVREELMPHTRPLWKKIWDEHHEGIIILTIVGLIYLLWHLVRMWNN